MATLNKGLSNVLFMRELVLPILVGHFFNEIQQMNQLELEQSEILNVVLHLLDPPIEGL